MTLCYARRCLRSSRTRAHVFRWCGEKSPAKTKRKEEEDEDARAKKKEVVEEEEGEAYNAPAYVHVRGWAARRPSQKRERR